MRTLLVAVIAGAAVATVAADRTGAGWPATHRAAAVSATAAPPTGGTGGELGGSEWG